uniref:Uncharacterized protein n=1 Tax=Physcomitrium patens TaxID=3218 RepID=A0A7I4CVU0_PHYPA
MEYDPEHLFLVLQNKASNQTSFPSEILHDDAARAFGNSNTLFFNIFCSTRLVVRLALAAAVLRLTVGSVAVHAEK